MLDSFEKAFAGKWEVSLIKIDDVRYTNDWEIISWKVKYNVPYEGKRINLFYDVDSTFDSTTGLWLTSYYVQYVPHEVPVSRPVQKPSYWEKTLDQAQSNMQQMNSMLGGGYSAPISSTSTYDSNKQFRDNQRRQ